MLGPNTKGQMSTKKEKLAYIAGIIDGEGMVVARRYAGSPSYQLVVGISNTNKDVLDFIGSFYGFGKPFAINKQSKSRRPAWNYLAVSNKAKEILESVLPYLIIKRNHALLGIEYQNVIDSFGRKTGKVMSKGEIESRDKIAKKIKALSMKGRKNVII